MKLSDALLVLMLVTQAAVADTASKLKACDLALSGCEALSAEQDKQIAQLKNQVKQLENKVADETPSFLPTWAWVLIGASAGAIVGVGVRK